MLSYLKKTWWGDLPQHIRVVGCREKLRIDPETICRWRDRYHATGEVKDLPPAGRLRWHRQNKRGCVQDFKTATFWCDPESIKCPELCYFTLIFRKKGIKSKLHSKAYGQTHRIIFVSSVFQVNFFPGEAKLLLASLLWTFMGPHWTQWSLVESHRWPQQTWGQRSSRDQWPLVQVLKKKDHSILILWRIFKGLWVQWSLGRVTIHYTTTQKVQWW